MSNTNQKIETLNKLRTTEAIYVLMSSCTRMPYVVCDPETFDDEILLYYTEAEAKEEAMKLQKEGNPMQLVKVDENSRLSFFTGLFPMGVNCILVDKGLDGQITVQLDELITRPKDEELPEGKIRVENPELVLTAAYFMQQMRKPDKPEMTDELKELNEEMLAHYQEGRYIVTVQEDKGIPILKQKDGKVYQPIFTDVQEVKKFQNLNKGVTLKIIENKKMKIARGILICGTGIGVSIAANKVPGAYAALVNNVYQAQRAQLSNNANIITLGAQVTGIELAKCLVKEYLSVTFDPESRSMPKVARITEYEKEGK